MWEGIKVEGGGVGGVPVDKTDVTTKPILDMLLLRSMLHLPNDCSIRINELVSIRAYLNIFHY